jgi:hypothetical protein
VRDELSQSHAADPRTKAIPRPKLDLLAGMKLNYQGMLRADRDVTDICNRCMTPVSGGPAAVVTPASDGERLLRHVDRTERERE